LRDNHVPGFKHPAISVFAAYFVIVRIHPLPDVGLILLDPGKDIDANPLQKPYAYADYGYNG